MRDTPLGRGFTQPCTNLRDLTQHGSKRQCSGTIKRGAWLRGGKLAAAATAIAVVAVPISEHNSTALSLSLSRLESPPPHLFTMGGGTSNRCSLPSSCLAAARSRGRVAPCYYVHPLPWPRLCGTTSFLPSGAASKVLVLSPSISFTIKIPLPPSLFIVRKHYEGKRASEWLNSTRGKKVSPPFQFDSPPRGNGGGRPASSFQASLSSSPSRCPRGSRSTPFPEFTAAAPLGDLEVNSHVQNIFPRIFPRIFPKSNLIFLL